MCFRAQLDWTAVILIKCNNAATSYYHQEERAVTQATALRIIYHFGVELFSGDLLLVHGRNCVVEEVYGA